MLDPAAACRLGLTTQEADQLAVGEERDGLAQVLLKPGDGSEYGNGTAYGQRQPESASPRIIEMQAGLAARQRGQLGE